VTDLLKRCPKTSHPIAQDCFKLLGAQLRQCQRWQPSPAQLRFLLTWAFTDLEEGGGGGHAFHLLRAILSRKLVLPEVYDLMNRVQVGGGRFEVVLVCCEAVDQTAGDPPGFVLCCVARAAAWASAACYSAATVQDKPA
jgi:hypothetical protein